MDCKKFNNFFSKFFALVFHSDRAAGITKIKTDVEGGSAFAEALKKHPKVFDNLYVNLVAAGELGGVLDTILQRLAAYIEKKRKACQQGQGRHDIPFGYRRGCHCRYSCAPDFCYPGFC